MTHMYHNLAKLDASTLRKRKQACQHERDELTRQLELYNSRPLKIALLGIRGACKTSLLASLYLFGREDEGDSALVAAWDRKNGPAAIDLQPDERSMAMLRRLARDIERHGTSTATASGRPEGVRFDMRVDGHSCAVETLDFSGYFLEPMEGEDELKELAEQARSFIRGSDAVVCLVNWNEDALETTNALDVCFSTLRSAKAKFILGITKFDERWAIPTSAAEEAEIIRKCEKANPTIAKLRRRLTQLYSDSPHSFATTLLAPLGDDFASDPRRLPVRRQELRPHNIAGPFLHAFRRRRGLAGSLEEQRREVIQELAAIDEQLEVMAELRRVHRLQQIERRYEALAGSDLAILNGPQAEREIESLAQEARTLGGAVLAGKLSSLIAQRQQRTFQARRVRAEKRFCALVDEIYRGSWFGADEQYQELKKLNDFAKRIGDEDFEDEIAAEMRRLKSRQYVRNVVERLGLKGAEMALYCAVVVLALLGAGLTAFLVHLVVRS